MLYIAAQYIENYGIISSDLVTGFDTSFGNSDKFRFSFGTEITRISANFPIRLGFSLGGSLPNSYSLGAGYEAGSFSINFGRKYYHGLIRNRAKGVEMGLNVSIDTSNFLSDNSARFKKIRNFFKKIKLPKLPKLPKSRF